jgi:aldehyde dehydrogenase (NAD+)
MSTLLNPKVRDIQAASPLRATEPASIEQLFERQRAYFATDVTKTYDWRADQLDRLTRMLKENSERFADASRKDFKTASQENVFEVSATIATSESTKFQLKEWMKPVEDLFPNSLLRPGTREWCTASLTASP